MESLRGDERRRSAARALGPRFVDPGRDPEAARELYRESFEVAFETGEPWEHDYECSSATAFREFRMTAISLRSPIMLVTHALRVERAHDRTSEPADDEAYVANGVMVMCMYCRHVKHRATLRWHWVPGYVETMPKNVSHGLCPRCSEVYFHD